jgi:membrane protein YdbS with pleckstrin-like domain
MYRVIDVQLRVGFWQRLFGLGTVHCVTSDATNKTITLKNIRHAKDIKDFIYRASEDAKLRRRTVNMQNIGAYEDLDGDGFPD